MARNRGKLSPYEVIGRSKSKSNYDKTLKKDLPEKSESDKQVIPESAQPATVRTTRWPRKPKLLQFNAGRIEISLPYPLAIAVFLGIILLFLMALWLGETSYLKRKGITNSAGSVLNSLQKKIERGNAGSNENEKISPDVGKAVTGTGSNRIVIQTYDKRADLELVQYHFAEGGIETEIRKIGGTFYLVSADKYEKDPKIEGTDGYAAIQKIVELGAKYKAPQGYETFGAKSFKTAFGMKFDD
ncbi:MAG: hypothetical protein ACYSSN_04190 [Planctomycetota bacterium]|jgi:hypothetical protein